MPAGAVQAGVSCGLMHYPTAAAACEACSLLIRCSSQARHIDVHPGHDLHAATLLHYTEQVTIREDRIRIAVCC